MGDGPPVAVSVNRYRWAALLPGDGPGSAAGGRLPVLDRGEGAMQALGIKPSLFQGIAE